MSINQDYAEEITHRIITIHYPDIEGNDSFPEIIQAPSHRNPITGEKIPHSVAGQIGITPETSDHKIIIYPSKNRNPRTLAEVLAHEIGHYIDSLQNPRSIIEEQKKLEQRRQLLTKLRNALIIIGASLLIFPESRELGLRIIFLGPIITGVSAEALYNFAPQEERARKFAKRFYYNYIPVFKQTKD